MWGWNTSPRPSRWCCWPSRSYRSYDAFTIRLVSDKIFPLTVASVAIVCCVLMLFQMMRAEETSPLFADRESGGEDAEAPHGLWSTLGWFAMLLGLSALVGFILALAVFLVSFLRVRAGATWVRTLTLSGLGIGFMSAMAWVLNRDFPPGLLQEYVTLPWPLI